jgi:hypothetical protein
MDIAVERARPVVAEAELRQRLATLQSLLGEAERERA